MRAWIFCLFLLVCSRAGAQAQPLAGDWQGTLDAGTAQLHLVLHLTAAADGSYRGTLDSVDQNANGIPLASITFKENQLAFEVPAIKGSYKGKYDAAKNSLDGTWSQGASLPLKFVRAAAAGSPSAAAKAVAPTDIDDSWQGTLNAGGASLRLVLHLFNSDAGLKATLDSLDQGAMAIPASQVTREKDQLTAVWARIGGTYKGSVSADRQSIVGTWTQGGAPLPLVFKKGGAAPKAAGRPQMPAPPFPYREVEVTYPNKGAGIELAGTLTLPSGKGPFPAVVLITGSGPQNRDEELMGHKPFLVLADYLTRRGIAVLRADDRGVGKSTGKFETATTPDFATDVEAGVAFLRGRPEIDHGRIGLLGHSEGGVIAPMVAARDHDIAFVVMLAGTSVSGEQILLAQQRLISQSMGVNADALERSSARNKKVFQLLREESDDATFTRKFTEQYAEGLTPEQVQAQTKQFTSPWFRYFLTYDPAPALRQTRCPVLALNGAKDLQVPPDLNLPLIRQILANRAGSEVVELPELNHLFQTAKSGAPREYAQIEETMSPAALAKIGDWITQRTGLVPAH